ncbi:hypothetical protein [Methylobacterium durans]|uniref:hypothetical protein n=1 Tax=Methylobacterium durans TaxID=2202825 RepID=UPI001F3883D1|nr:hypothetical protein [Methylobacterium durans]
MTSTIASRATRAPVRVTASPRIRKTRPGACARKKGTFARSASARLRAPETARRVAVAATWALRPGLPVWTVTMGRSVSNRGRSTPGTRASSITERNSTGASGRPEAACGPFTAGRSACACCSRPRAAASRRRRRLRAAAPVSGPAPRRRAATSSGAAVLRSTLPLSLTTETASVVPSSRLQRRGAPSGPKRAAIRSPPGRPARRSRIAIATAPSAPASARASCAAARASIAR